MCVAVPVQVESTEGTVGIVNAGGNRVKIDLSLVDGVESGDYVILHAGFAIQRYDKAEAEETLRLFEEMARAEKEGKP